MKRFLLLLCVILSINIGVLATGSIDLSNPLLELKSSRGIDDICTKVNRVSQERCSFNFMGKGSASNGNTTVVLNMKEYTGDLVSAEDRKEIISTALEAIKDSNNLAQYDKNRLYNFIESQDNATASLVRQLSTDVNANFASAYAWFKPASGPLSTFLGLLALALFIGLTTSIIIDLSYLIIPLVHWALTSASKEEKPKIVSNEAYLAVQEAEKNSNANKTTYLAIYIRKKAFQIVILAICILYLAGGKIYNLISWVIDAFQGLVA